MGKSKVANLQGSGGGHGSPRIQPRRRGKEDVGVVSAGEQSILEVAVWPLWANKEEPCHCYKETTTVITLKTLQGQSHSHKAILSIDSINFSFLP